MQGASERVLSDAARPVATPMTDGANIRCSNIDALSIDADDRMFDDTSRDGARRLVLPENST